MKNIIKRGIKNEKQNVKEIFLRIRKRDFSGDSGQAIKNSSYQLATNLVMKFGALLFTIVLARMLMPERLGLYSLALSTIILFAAFSDLGISSALITFVSNELGKKNSAKAKGYIKKLFRWKIYLLFITSGILLLSSYFIANYYYNKPIFYALLVGGLYLPIAGLLGFLEQSFKATNNFKKPLIKEIIFQGLRFGLVPLGILLLLETNLSNKLIVALILLIITFCYSGALLFLGISARKNLKFLRIRAKDLSQQEMGKLKKFILPLSVTALSGIFFGYIDMIMLGHFVAEEFIAQYWVAFTLIGSASAIIGFTAMGLFPIFSKLKGPPLERIFKKTKNFTLMISLFAGIVTYFLAYYIIRVAYGKDYLMATPILKYLAILVVILPLIALYNVYLTSQRKTKIIAWLLVGSTLVNIILNYFGITYGLRFGMFEAVLGVCFATIISRFLYFAGLILFKQRRKVFNPFSGHQN